MSFDPDTNQLRSGFVSASKERRLAYAELPTDVVDRGPGVGLPQGHRDLFFTELALARPSVPSPLDRGSWPDPNLPRRREPPGTEDRGDDPGCLWFGVQRQTNELLATDAGRSACNDSPRAPYPATIGRTRISKRRRHYSCSSHQRSPARREPHGRRPGRDRQAHMTWPPPPAFAAPPRYLPAGPCARAGCRWIGMKPQSDQVRGEPRLGQRLRGARCRATSRPHLMWERRWCFPRPSRVRMGKRQAAVWRQGFNSREPSYSSFRSRPRHSRRRNSNPPSPSAWPTTPLARRR